MLKDKSKIAVARDSWQRQAARETIEEYRRDQGLCPLCGNPHHVDMSTIRNLTGFMLCGDCNRTARRMLRNGATDVAVRQHLRR